MFRFVATRILAAIPVLLILSVVTFGIIKAQPGDYADYLKSMLMSQGNVSDQDAQKQADAYRASHGLNAPLPLQYVNWITGIVTRFDFGDSLYYNKPVGAVVSERLSRTLLLALTCHILASAIGITLGIVAATRQYSWVDTLFGVVSFRQEIVYVKKQSPESQAPCVAGSRVISSEGIWVVLPMWRAAN